MDYVVDLKNGGTGCVEASAFSNRLLNESNSYFVEVDNKYLDSVWDIYMDLKKCDRGVFNQSSIVWNITDTPTSTIPFDLTNGWKITRVVLFSGTDYDDYSTWELIDNLPVQTQAFEPIDATSFTQTVNMQGTEFADYINSLAMDNKELYAKYIAAYRPGEKN